MGTPAGRASRWIMRSSLVAGFLMLTAALCHDATDQGGGIVVETSSETPTVQAGQPCEWRTVVRNESGRTVRVVGMEFC